MSWKENFKNGFDFTYEMVKREYPEIKYPCYGTRYYYTSLSFKLHSENLYFYLTPHSLIYTRNGISFKEIPFNTIRNMTIKQGFIFKGSYDIRIVANEGHHFNINIIKDFSTGLTGSSADNVKGFLDTLKSKVQNQ